MSVHVLTLVRAVTVYSVPPVCSVYWTPADWNRSARRTCEPLAFRAIGLDWVSTGTRDKVGKLLYEVSK
jgi:hypothetical protein